MASTPVMSPRQMRRMENLPQDYKIVNTRDGVVILRRCGWAAAANASPTARLAPNLSVERVPGLPARHG